MCLSPSCRYVSIILLTVSNLGYFYHGFSTEVCSTYYLVSPAFKGESLTIPAYAIPSRVAQSSRL